MNHIHALTARAASTETLLAAKDAAIEEFRIHLAGSKFRGVDIDGGRKDWIAVSDVLAWLNRIREAGG